MFGCCERRAPVITPTMGKNPAGAQGGNGGSFGVGLVFQPDHTGALRVRSLAVNGPAATSGILIGDELHEIDGNFVLRKPVSELAPLILGPAGTTVRLGFKRGDSQHLIYFELRRGWTLSATQPQAENVFSHPLPVNARLHHLSQ